MVRTAILENSIKSEVLRVKGTSLTKPVDTTLVKAEKVRPTESLDLVGRCYRELVDLGMGGSKKSHSLMSGSSNISVRNSFREFSVGPEARKTETSRRKKDLSRKLWTSKSCHEICLVSDRFIFFICQESMMIFFLVGHFGDFLLLQQDYNLSY